MDHVRLGASLVSDERGGSCHWAGCEAEADYVIQDVTVSYMGRMFFVGDVEVCGGHFNRAKRLGRITLDPEVLVFAAEQMQ